MIHVNLKGGLGNQMFQYAAGRRLAAIHKTGFKLDLSFLLHLQKREAVTQRKYALSIFNIIENFATPAETQKLKNMATRTLRKYWPGYKSNPYIKEKHFHFDPSILSLKNNCYLDGHWMSEKYFIDIEPTVRKEFTFKKSVLEEGREILSEILSTDSVCIQVRRGDYVTNPQISRVHETTSLKYFEEAIALISAEIKNPVFFVFSDDSEWCIRHLPKLPQIHFVEKRLINTKADDSDYLQLMSACRYFIISNSTFAWWGAWLSAYEKKIVVAPKNWFNIESIITTDIYPTKWIKI